MIPSIYKSHAERAQNDEFWEIKDLTDTVQSDLLLLFVFLGAACSLLVATSEHEVLDAQVSITDALEDTAQLECPGDGFLAHEEIGHLAAITDDPGSQDG